MCRIKHFVINNLILKLFSLLKYSRNQSCGIVYLFKTSSVNSSLPHGPLGIPVAYLSRLFWFQFCVFCQVTRSASAGSIFSPPSSPSATIYYAFLSLATSSLVQILPPYLCLNSAKAVSGVLAVTMVYYF